MKKPALTIKRPNLPGPGGSRTGVSLLAAAGVLAVVLGVAELRPPAAPASGAAGSAASAQVERTAVVCPEPRQGLTGTTTITALTPGSGGPASGGSGTVRDVLPPAAPAAPAAPAPGAPSAAASGSPAPAAPAPAAPGQPSDARLTLAKPGVPVSVGAAPADNAPGSVAVGAGSFAPGFTVTQTTTVTDSRGMGMSGVTCQPSGTSFWFAGASTAGDRADYVSVTNADSTSAVIDVRLYGDQGEIDNDAASGITIAPGTSQAILLSTLAKTPSVADLAVQVVARSGRVGAYLHAADGSKGADWVPASQDPAAVQVLPGLPADLADARLVVADPGQDDADLKIQLSGQNGWFTPAGFETIHVKAGMVSAVDLKTVNRQEASALRLSPTDDKHAVPVVAGVRVDRAGNGKSDSAWLTGSPSAGKRATVADARGGGTTTLYLTATGDAASVRVTASAGAGGGTPTTKDVQVPAGATVALPAPEPAGGSGPFGLTVETVSGGPVTAARMLAVPYKDDPMFTVQALTDDHSFVQVPHADQDPGVLLR